MIWTWDLSRDGICRQREHEEPCFNVQACDLSILEWACLIPTTRGSVINPFRQPPLARMFVMWG
jgi:hypothetical protein